MKGIIDTNVIFSALLKKESKIKKLIFDPSNKFYTCNFLFIELFKYKEKIEKISQLDFNDILRSMKILLSKIRFVHEDIIPPQIYQKARELCSDIDENDIPFVALSLFIDAPIITRDKKLRNGLNKKGFEEIILLETLIE